MKNRYLVGVLVLLLVLVGTGCTSTDTSPMVFRIGATTVTVNQYRQRLEEQLGPAIEQLLARGQTQADITAQAEQQNVWQSILDEMIQEELLLDYARKQGIGVDAAEVDKAIEQQATRGDTAAGTPTGEEMTRQREELARQQLVGKVILQNTRADMHRSKHILVEDEATAQEIVEQLEGGADFAELAKQYSKDPGSADKGGAYGWVARGDFVPEYEDAAFSAELNKPVVVKSQFGYHVIVVEEREENRPYDTFEHLNSSQSARTHYEQTFIPWYDTLRADAEASGDLVINKEFDPKSISLPFPSQMSPSQAPESSPQSQPQATAMPEPTEPALQVEPPTTATPAR